jgi:methylene-fatty-acyl-phospholipid synthase
MMTGLVAWAAILLSLERAFYLWIGAAPQVFMRLCRAIGPVSPVRAVEALFYVFKAIQGGVFFWWCAVASAGSPWPLSAGPLTITIGLALISLGLALNVMVFRLLGRNGVFYGAEFGLPMPQRNEPPFTWMRHPQYVGAAAVVWGACLVARFPHGDWFWLPAIATLYYWIGATFERYAHTNAVRRADRRAAPHTEPHPAE